jgi:hypothetical protein
MNPRADQIAMEDQMARTLAQHEPPPGVTLSTVPTIRGRAGAHRWLNDMLGVPVRLNYVRGATARGEIPSVRMSGALFFSTRGLFDWIMSASERSA